MYVHVCVRMCMCICLSVCMSTSECITRFSSVRRQFYWTRYWIRLTQCDILNYICQGMDAGLRCSTYYKCCVCTCVCSSHKQQGTWWDSIDSHWFSQFHELGETVVNGASLASALAYLRYGDPGCCQSETTCEHHHCWLRHITWHE